jgi:hypothetical protein
MPRTEPTKFTATESNNKWEQLSDFARDNQSHG